MIGCQGNSGEEGWNVDLKKSNQSSDNVPCLLNAFMHVYTSQESSRMYVACSVNNKVTGDMNCLQMWKKERLK